MKLGKSGSSQVPKNSMHHRAGLSFKRIAKGRAAPFPLRPGSGKMISCFKKISCFDSMKQHGIDEEELLRVKSCKKKRRFVVLEDDEEELMGVKSCKKSLCKKSPGRVLKELEVLVPVEYDPFQEDLLVFPPELVELKGFCGECYMDGEDWNECPHRDGYCLFCDKRGDHCTSMCPKMKKDPDAFEKLLRSC